PRDNFALRAVGASASEPNESCLLPFLALPIDFEQSNDLVLFEHGSKRGFETLFLAVLMAAATWFRRQRFDFRLRPPQPILERLRLRCSKVLGLNHLHTLGEGERFERPVRPGRNLRRALTRQLVTAADPFASLFAERCQSLLATQCRIDPGGGPHLNLPSHRRNPPIPI